MTFAVPRSPGRRCAGASVVAAALAAALTLGGSPAGAQEARNGGRLQVSPTEGGSSTPFEVDIPGRPECPGDSPDDGYRVNSYMVPASVDPATITYDGLGPAPASFGTYETFREPLFDTNTNSFVSAQTADAEAPDEPGPIINLPAFSFGVYQPGDLPPGRYHIGIACTLLNEVVTVWDTGLVVSETATDEPAQVRWRVLDVEGPTSSTGLSTSALLAGAGAGAVALAVLVQRTRRPRADSRSQPTPRPSLEDR
ncbi:MAG: hypothetical protein Q8K58_00430 [Acidimicrobiales bacterium]|nr:hypothetical protein [Acidimicrobiales bacterium]